MKHWIVLTREHAEAVWIQTGQQYSYDVAPVDDVKSGDTVYLWSNPHMSLYGWGEVAEAPRLITIEVPRPDNDMEIRKRTLILLTGIRQLDPPVTEQMMRGDRNLRKLIPRGYDDLYALRLRPGQANYINDFIRERKLEAPRGSATIRWFGEEIPPQVSIQALITAGDKVSEGRLVEGVSIAWYEVIRMIARNPEDIYNIDPRKFEELIAGAYERAGYDEVILTPQSGDKGRDIIATKNGLGSIRIFDQVKRNRISHVVTAHDVQALLGVLSTAPNVSKGVFTTSGIFAPTLLDNEEIARMVPHRLELRPRDVLIPWLLKLGGR